MYTMKSMAAKLIKSKDSTGVIEFNGNQPIHLVSSISTKVDIPSIGNIAIKLKIMNLTDFTQFSTECIQIHLKSC